MGEKAMKEKVITKVLSCLVVFAILMSVFSVAVIATNSSNSTASNVTLTLNDEANSSVESMCIMPSGNSDLSDASNTSSPDIINESDEVPDPDLPVINDTDVDTAKTVSSMSSCSYVWIKITDKYCKGYKVYVDGKYELKEDGDGYCHFTVTPGYHTFKLTLDGKEVSNGWNCQCGHVYNWMSMNEMDPHWCEDGGNDNPTDEYEVKFQGTVTSIIPSEYDCGFKDVYICEVKIEKVVFGDYFEKGDIVNIVYSQWRENAHACGTYDKVSVGDTVEVYGEMIPIYCVGTWITICGKSSYYLKKIDSGSLSIDVWTADASKNTKTEFEPGGNIYIWVKTNRPVTIDLIVDIYYDSGGHTQKYLREDKRLSAANEYYNVWTAGEPGKRVLTLKAWDDYGNYAEDKWTFHVKGTTEQEITFTGTAIEYFSLIGAGGWYVKVDKIISGPSELQGHTVSVYLAPVDPDQYPPGYMDPNIESGDKVKVYGLYQGEDNVALFGSVDYYIKKDVEEPKTGSLTVTIYPLEVRSGAWWKLTSGPDTNWHSSGYTITNIPLDYYTIRFSDVTGWTKPSDKTVTITEGSNYESGWYTKEKENQSPTAHIVSIRPNPANQGETVSFSGYGTDPDGDLITAYNWRSSIDGQLSTSPSFSTSRLSVGAHTIYFKVKDSHNAWSDEILMSLDISSKIKFNGTFIEQNVFMGFLSYYFEVDEAPEGSVPVGDKIRVYVYIDSRPHFDNYDQLGSGDRAEVYAEFEEWRGKEFDQWVDYKVWVADITGDKKYYVKKIEEKPDLIIQDISWDKGSPKQGDTITFTVKIKNQGSGSAGTSAVKYYIDDTYVASDSVPALSAGSTESTQSFTWTADKCENVQVKAVADATNAVDESNEGNNEWAEIVNIICINILPVPYEYQGAGWCVPASCAMVLQYYGASQSSGGEPCPIHFWDIAQYNELEKNEGMTIKDIKNYFEHSNELSTFNIRVPFYWLSGPFSHDIPDDVKRKILFSLDKNIPVIVGGRWEVLPGGHSVVVVGYKITESDDIILYINDPSGRLTDKISDTGRRIAAPMTWEDFNNFGGGWADKTEVANITADVLYPIHGNGSLEFYDFSIKKTTLGTPIYYADFSKGLKWYDGSTQKPVCYINENIEVSSDDFNHVWINFFVSNHHQSEQKFKVKVKDAETGWVSEPEGVSVPGLSVYYNTPYFRIEEEDIGLGSHSLYVELYEIGGNLADRIGPFRFNIASIKPDIIIQDISWKPENPKQGDNVEFAVTVKNIGKETAGESHVFVYAINWDAGKILFKINDACPSLKSGEAYTYHKNVKIEDCGEYDLMAWADARNEVDESNEENNYEGASFTVPCTKEEETLVVNVYSIDGKPAAEVKGTTTIELIKSGEVSPTAKQNIDDKSRVTFTDIPAGNYYINVYHNPQLEQGSKEFWGQRKDVAITAGKTTTIDFHRYNPYVEKFYAEKNSVEVNTPVKINVGIKVPSNCPDAEAYVKALVIIRDENGHEVYRKESDDRKVQRGDSTSFSFSYTPIKEGTYSGLAKAYIVGGGELCTDNCGWAKVFTCQKEKQGIKFRGTVTDEAGKGYTGGYWWKIKVDKWIKGSLPCSIVLAEYGIYSPLPYCDGNIQKGDMVEVYGVLDSYQQCDVCLNGEGFYIKNIEPRIHDAVVEGTITRVYNKLTPQYYSVNLKITKVIDDPSRKLSIGQVIDVIPIGFNFDEDVTAKGDIVEVCARPDPNYSAYVLRSKYHHIRILVRNTPVKVYESPQVIILAMPDSSDNPVEKTIIKEIVTNAMGQILQEGAKSLAGAFASSLTGGIWSFLMLSRPVGSPPKISVNLQCKSLLLKTAPGVKAEEPVYVAVNLFTGGEVGKTLNLDIESIHNKTRKELRFISVPESNQFSFELCRNYCIIFKEPVKFTTDAGIGYIKASYGDASDIKTVLIL